MELLIRILKDIIVNLTNFGTNKSLNLNILSEQNLAGGFRHTLYLWVPKPINIRRKLNLSHFACSKFELNSQKED